jgi:hypothetical protein
MIMIALESAAISNKSIVTVAMLTLGLRQNASLTRRLIGQRGCLP